MVKRLWSCLAIDLITQVFTIPIIQSSKPVQIKRALWLDLRLTNQRLIITSFLNWVDIILRFWTCWFIVIETCVFTVPILQSTHIGRFPPAIRPELRFNSQRLNSVWKIVIVVVRILRRIIWFSEGIKTNVRIPCFSIFFSGRFPWAPRLDSSFTGRFLWALRFEIRLCYRLWLNLGIFWNWGTNDICVNLALQVLKCFVKKLWVWVVNLLRIKIILSLRHLCP